MLQCSKAPIALRWLIHVTINPTDVYIKCKNTKNAKHHRSIGSKRIKYIMFGVLLKKHSLIFMTFGTKDNILGAN